MAGPAQEVAGAAAPVPEPGITERTGAVTQRPARRASHRLRRDRWARRLWAAAFTTAAIALFAAYIRLSATYPVNSDGANIVLMSWDMLHGNLLLHGWWMSDVSFYTTELPEYMLIDAIRGLSPDVTHIAAALTYTLVLVLTVLLAKSRATARDGAARVLISGGIMLAPQLGVGIFVLLLSVGHIGTAVPALAVVADPGPGAAALVRPGHHRMPARLGDGRRLPHPRGGHRAAGPGQRGPRALVACCRDGGRPVTRGSPVSAGRAR